MAQTAGTLCIRLLPEPIRSMRVYLLTIDKAKFRKPVLPGDRLEYHMHRMKRRKNMWWYRGEAKVDGVIVAEAELGAMMAEA
jgi:3-hydroxyacyl-[acyl-carrier-protein] dehydratase